MYLEEIKKLIENGQAYVRKYYNSKVLAEKLE